jgi:hypothetical protein
MLEGDRAVNRTARQVFAVLVVLTFAGCDATKAPSSSGPARTGPTAATETTGPAPTATNATNATEETTDTGPVTLQKGLFTSQVDPLIVTSTPDGDHATSADVSPDGATLETTGVDGTAYSLAIPKGSLPFTVTITMTPIASLTGFSADTTPTHIFGVELGPQGLELPLPATLTITPAVELAPASALSFDARGPGAPVGLRYSDQDSRSITMSIDHFSLYFTGSPFTISDIPPSTLDRWLRGLDRTAEEELAAEVAYLLGELRQRQLMNVDENYSIRDIARAALTVFRRVVISPRVAVADKSCGNAVSAMSAYLEYQRQRQTLGVGDDPEFDLPGAGFMVPAALVELAETVCFKEAYERCAKTGDFPSLALYLFELLVRADTSLGVPPTADSIGLAHDYLRRCGRWRLHLTTSMEEHGNDVIVHDTTREFYLQWQPAAAGDEGFGPGFGLVGSKIDGHGLVDTLRLSVTSKACGPDDITVVTSTEDASATIDKLEFDHYEGPTLTGDPLPPVPKTLEVTVKLGEVDYVHAGTCPQGDQVPTESSDRFLFLYGLIVKNQGDSFTPDQVKALLAGEGESATIHLGWQFSTNPFKAVQPMDATLDASTSCEVPCPVTVRLEAILEHDPK